MSKDELPHRPMVIAPICFFLGGRGAGEHMDGSGCPHTWQIIDLSISQPSPKTTPTVAAVQFIWTLSFSLSLSLSLSPLSFSAAAAAAILNGLLKLGISRFINHLFVASSAN